MSMRDKSNREKASTFDIIAIVIYIAVFIFVTIFQNKLFSLGKNGVIMLGICTQLLSLLSAFVVVIVPKYGYYFAMFLNVIASLRLIFTIISKNETSAITGLISTVASAILITIIYFFYKKINKNNEELLKANAILREKDEKLSYLAYYDILTGLPNRQLFIERIDEAINASAQSPFTVIAANIDNFKIINNEYGNNAGDAVLCAYSKRLKNLCGNSTFLARINGDEFGFILYGKESDATILNYVDTIKEVVSEPIKYQDTKLNITMSFGIALYPLNATESTEILKCVSSALTVSKSNGKNTHYFYNNLF